MKYEAVVNRLAAYRKQCNLRQNELADQFSMTQSQYSKVEAGKIKLSFDNLYVLQTKGCDIDFLITGEQNETLLPCLNRLALMKDDQQFLSLMKLCEWAWEQWELDGGVPEGIGGQLFKIWAGVDGRKDSQWVRLRKAYNDTSQMKMANQIGVNIKKYRLLEQEDVKPDAELLLNVYKLTECKPGFFMDERGYYLSLINEACKGNERREEQLQMILEIVDKFKK